MTIGKAVLRVALTLLPAATAAQTTSLPSAPLINSYPVLDSGILTHVYDYEWFSSGASLDLGSDTIGICDYDGGRLCITSARLVNSTLPKSYDSRFAVKVTLARVSPTGDVTTLKSNYTYCSGCGRIARETPTITLNGSEDETADVTYGDKLDHSTNARIEEAGNPIIIIAGGTEAFLDGGGEPLDRDSIVSAGRHTLRVVSKQIGNNVFSPSKGKVRVGFAQAEKTFTLTVAPLRLTFSEPLTIAPRPADGTTRLGKLTLPRPDNAPDGGEDPKVEIAEIDSTDVRPEAGEYTVRYRLATRSANYTTDEAAWHATTFTITASGDTTATPAEPSRPAIPSPDTDPDFFGRPLISHGSPLGDEGLTRVYDPDWYAKGGEVKQERPPALARCGEGTIVITGAFIGHAASSGEVRYPASYEEPLPVYVSLGFVDDGGDTTDIEGRHVYCDGCGGVRRDTPEISVDGVATEGGVQITYGEPLLCRTSARLTRVVNGQTVIVAGGVDITMDGEMAYNGDLPTAGTHVLRVVSKRLGNDNLDPSRGDVEVGFAQTEKTFTLTVSPLRLTFSEPLSIAPRPADGTARLGKLTLPRPDNAPDGGSDPLVALAEIDSTDVRPEAGEYAVRYRLATRSANYTTDEAAWHATTFTITASGDTTATPAEPSRPAIPSPDTDPDFFGRPLISHGSPLGDEDLTRIYDPDWFAKGGEVEMARPPALARLGEGTIVITGAFIGHAASGVEGGEVRYPASYDEPLPVYVSLGFVDDGGDTTDIEGRHVYCDACGGVRRDTPEISVDGVATGGGVQITYGEPLLCRTSARLTRSVNGQTVIVAGGVDITMDGEVAYNGDLPAAGTHELRVVSKRLGNDNLDPARGDVEVGFAQAEKTFTLTVAPLRLTFSEPLSIAPRPADGSTRLGKITLPRPDNAPDGGSDPLVALAEIDSADVRPEAGEYAVRYRLATRSANYTTDEAAWHATTFTITTSGDTTATPAEPSRPALPSPDTDPDFFSQPLISHGSPLGDDVLTRVYDPDWYAKDGAVEMARPPALARWGEGTIVITGAFIGHAASGVEGGEVRYPASYEEPLPVYVSLGFVDDGGDTTDIEGRHVYCDACGGVRRDTPEISVDGVATEGDGVATTYGEPLLCRTSARLTRVVNGQTVIVAGGVDITMDGGMAYNGDLPAAGTHELRVVSKRLGNDNLAPARGQVEVGFAQAEKTFTLTVSPLRLTFSEPLTIAPRPADGTARLGKLTLPRPDNAPDGGSDPLVAIAEIDSADVRPEAGEYAVRYRLTTRSADYTTDEAAWHATTFTITASGDTTATPAEPPRPALPSPDTDPDFFGRPLISHGSPLGDKSLTRVYDPDWYAKGGEVKLERPPALARWGEGTIVITGAFIGHAASGVEDCEVRYPASYDEPLPVFVSLGFADDGGDTTDIEGRHVYCDACGGVRRDTPEISVDGVATGGGVATTYGEPLLCRTSARLTRVVNGQTVIVAGGVDITMDGEVAYNGDLPAAGTHELQVVSKRLGNDNLDPARGQVEVGFAQAEKTFTLTVSPLRLTFSEPLTIAPRPADGTARLGKLTLPRPDNAPDGGEDPLIALAEIDSADVRPEAGQYAVRYRLATRSANYSVDEAAWHATTFTITEGKAGACAKGIVRLKFGNTLVADNAGGEYAAYQWLADGEEIVGAIKQYYHANPLPEAAYSVRLTRKDGTTLSSCPLNVGGTQTGLGIRAEGDGLDTVIEVTGAEAEGALVVAYTSGGMMVGRARTGRDGAVRMRLPKGIVILRAESGGRMAEMSMACH